MEVGGKKGIMVWSSDMLQIKFDSSICVSYVYLIKKKKNTKPLRLHSVVHFWGMAEEGYSLQCWFYGDECDSCWHFAVARSLRFLQLVQFVSLQQELVLSNKINPCYYKASCIHISFTPDHHYVEGTRFVRRSLWVAGMWFTHHENPFSDFKPSTNVILTWICPLSWPGDRDSHIVRSQLPPLPSWGHK